MIMIELIIVLVIVMNKIKKHMNYYVISYYNNIIINKLNFNEIIPVCVKTFINII